MLLLLSVAFISGLLTILAPCIWPVLPVIFVSSSGGKKKPLGITLGVMLSFTFLTLLVSYVARVIPFDPNVLRMVSAFILVAIGISFFIPHAIEMIEGFLSRTISNLNINTHYEGSGFWSGFVTGAALGSIWAPCAGPILAAIAVITATQALSSSVLLLIFFYVLGIGIPLFGFTLLGQKFTNKTQVLNKHSGVLQKVFGFIMIVVALGIYTGYDSKVQAKLLEKLPSYSNLLTSLETNDKVATELDKLQYGSDSAAIGSASGTKAKNLKDLGVAPEIIGINNWLNTEGPLTISQLQGKVVLVDFWTYSCINCIRTLPHVKEWYDKYKDEGLVVIGVHTPEFEFEKDTGNVQEALRKFEIEYPVAQDNDYKTWRNYKNRYWPAKYLIDAEGHLRYTHFGEGSYAETEKAIQDLLKEAGMTVDKSISNLQDTTPKSRQTPETYLGLARMDGFASKEKAVVGTSTYTFPDYLAKDKFAYQGAWTLTEEYAQASKDSQLIMNFSGQKVFLVITPANSGDQVEVYLDDKIVTSDVAGADVQNGVVTLDTDRLYELVDLASPEAHLLRLKFIDAGTKVFAFTFGS